MARKSTAEKAQSRDRILSAAADLFRHQGIGNTSVAQVMDHAGMTHGGFYRHFDSKSDLVAAAIDVAFRAGLDVFDNAGAGTAEQVRAYVDQYLSEQHIKEPEVGCPLPTLSPEVARGDKEWKQRLRQGFLTAVQKLEQGSDGASNTDALVALSLMVGTVVVGRGLGDPELASELLEASRAQVDALIGTNCVEAKAHHTS